MAKALEHVVLLYFLSNRKGFPAQLKNVKESEKKSNRGDIRWDREGDILSMPWGDKKVVSFLSSQCIMQTGSVLLTEDPKSTDST